MLLRLPRGLHYPITITKVLKEAGSNVGKYEPLFLYTYETTVREGSRDGDDKYVRKSFPAKFESGLEGQLKFWNIWEGNVLDRPYVIRESKSTRGTDYISGLISLKLRRNAHIQNNLLECVPTAERT